MDALQFCYWAQGFMEISQPSSLNTSQVQIIKDHLKIVLPKNPFEGIVDYYKNPKTWESQQYCSALEHLRGVPHVGQVIEGNFPISC